MTDKILREKSPSTSQNTNLEVDCPHQLLLQNAPVGIFTTTSSGEVLSINQTMAQILGFSSEEAALSYYTNLSNLLNPRH